MTVSYTAKISNSKGFGCFLKLLFRWRGSIYKLVWPHLFIFLSAYFSLSIIYRFLLNETQQRTFEKIAIYCEKYGSLIPVSFVLGFYVSVVVGRWWQQYINIPWIDTLAIWVNASINGEDEKQRVLRRTLMRYACLTITKCFTQISPRVKKRFPTLDHLVEGGLLLENEKEIIIEINTNVELGAKYVTHWIPIVWATSIVTRARAENKIKNDSATKALMDELNKIKDQCAMLMSYDWISVPLVYTQVVTLAVYIYFVSCVMGKQWLKYNVDTAGGSEGDALDLFFPIFPVFQFFFYMGWLKVAESLLNPFGDDDDDFELNWIVDRNIQVAYLIVDEMHRKHPELLRDQYWDEVVPPELPHTIASEVYNEAAPTNSTANVKMSRHDSELVLAPSYKSNLHLAPQEGGGDGSATPTSKRASTRLMHRSSSNRSNQSQMASAGGSVTKLNRIGSAFKRMISRDRNTPPDYGETEAGSMIYMVAQPSDHDAIPELDENMITITSTNRSGKLKPPTVQEIFGLQQDKTGDLNDKQIPPTSFDSMTVNTPSSSEEEKDPLSDVTTICISSGNLA